MGETADNHDDSSSQSQCFSKLSLLCVAAFFIPSLILVRLGFSPFLVTVSILCLSTIFLLIVSKKKSSSVKNPPENQQVEQEVNQETEAVNLLSSAAQESQISEFQDYQVESTDCPSASESSDGFSASEDFELNWACFDNLGKNVAVSEILGFSNDDDEEDEDDNLIEINFPDNSSAELNEESEEKLQIDFDFNDESEAKMQTELPESMFRQEGFMELLEEFNEVTEEENLIEIDLSMGSIKGHTY
ncbi:uncharacterized protein [Euphorbia lathyris]|uniref:uncharacterized protein n=1 Tax=Euphorbia lathyris TaxID=212925 RepID=UPI0033137DEE